jgi:hypothetical protein
VLSTARVSFFRLSSASSTVEMAAKTFDKVSALEQTKPPRRYHAQYKL